MRRIVLWLLSTLSCLVLLFAYKTSTAGPLATDAQVGFGTPSSTGTVSGGSSSAAGSSGGGSGGTSGSSSGSSSGSGSGSGSGSRTVTGSVAQTQWGPVQVKLRLSNGKVTKVEVLQYPNGNGRDAEINSYALPILTQETIKAQSAQIDMVSGATVTSDGYVQSLQSALDQVTS